MIYFIYQPALGSNIKSYTGQDWLVILVYHIDRPGLASDISHTLAGTS
jgi:hypothetical protein